MTTANKITILRTLLVPFFVVETIDYMETGKELSRVMAVVSFAVAAISDGVDGFIARRFNQRSELGAVLDPLADKLLLVSGIILLFERPFRVGDVIRLFFSYRHTPSLVETSLSRHGLLPRNAAKANRTMPPLPLTPLRLVNARK